MGVPFQTLIARMLVSCHNGHRLESLEGCGQYMVVSHVLKSEGCVPRAAYRLLPSAASGR